MTYSVKAGVKQGQRFLGLGNACYTGKLFSPVAASMESDVVELARDAFEVGPRDSIARHNIAHDEDAVRLGIFRGQRGIERAGKSCSAQMPPR